MPFVMIKSKSAIRTSVSSGFALFTLVLWVIFDLPFI